jgi:hypothetical protein
MNGGSLQHDPAMSHVDQAQKELEKTVEWADNPANK